MLRWLFSEYLLRDSAHGWCRSGRVCAVGMVPGEVSRTSVWLLHPGALATAWTEVKSRAFGAALVQA